MGNARNRGEPDFHNIRALGGHQSEGLTNLEQLGLLNVFQFVLVVLQRLVQPKGPGRSFIELGLQFGEPLVSLRYFLIQPLGPIGSLFEFIFQTVVLLLKLFTH